uniref:EF-hand domain-containing protein n=1 Tax=Megaselia scalaris TaxID=36166 RepID=T1GMX9_MEGSC
MAEPLEEGDLNLNEIWRTCRKIQTAVFQSNINIWKEYQNFDPNKNGLISESIFIGILGKYKNLIDYKK